MAKHKVKFRGSKSLKITETKEPVKVKMVFSEHKFYNDTTKPIFEAGKVYELEGADWIRRWLKRGGAIVEGDESVAVEPMAVVDTPPPQETAPEEKTDGQADDTLDTIDEL